MAADYEELFQSPVASMERHTPENKTTLLIGQSGGGKICISHCGQPDLFSTARQATPRHSKDIANAGLMQ